jgi:hypothetical protein
MTREEQIKAAIVVMPDAIAFASPAINQASEILGMHISHLVSFFHSLEPELERHEAILFTAAVLENLPELLQTSDGVIEGLKSNTRILIAKRRHDEQA